MQGIRAGWMLGMRAGKGVGMRACLEVICTEHDCEYPCLPSRLIALVSSRCHMPPSCPGPPLPPPHTHTSSGSSNGPYLHSFQPCGHRGKSATVRPPSSTTWRRGPLSFRLAA